MLLVDQNNPQAKEVLDLKAKILEKTQEIVVKHLMETKQHISAELLLNTFVNITVQTALIVAQGDKEKLLHIANELRYSIVGQLK